MPFHTVHVIFKNVKNLNQHYTSPTNHPKEDGGTR